MPVGLATQPKYNTVSFPAYGRRRVSIEMISVAALTILFSVSLHGMLAILLFLLFGRYASAGNIPITVVMSSRQYAQEQMLRHSFVAGDTPSPSLPCTHAFKSV